MKRNTIYLILLMILAAVSGYVLMNRKSGTIERELSDFAVKDTGRVVKIFMADKAGNRVTIERVSEFGWQLNGESEARPDAVNSLLTTMTQVDVRSPVARAAYNNIMKGLAANGIKVEIYDVNGLLKTYYVGGPTQDHRGTYMYLEGSSVPFITQIPGFEGYLTPRYIVKAEEWKTRRIFSIPVDRIQMVEALDISVSGRYMKLVRTDNDEFLVRNITGDEIPDVSQDKIRNYLNNYTFINYEMTESTLDEFQVDSLLKSEPFRRLSVVTTDGKQTRIDLWRRPITSSTAHKANTAGEQFPFDVDRMTARVNEDTTLLVVQYFTFDKLFRGAQAFVNK